MYNMSLLSYNYSLYILLSTLAYVILHTTPPVQQQRGSHRCMPSVQCHHWLCGRGFWWNMEDCDGNSRCLYDDNLLHPTECHWRVAFVRFAHHNTQGTHSQIHKSSLLRQTAGVVWWSHADHMGSYYCYRYDYYFPATQQQKSKCDAEVVCHCNTATPSK